MKLSVRQKAILALIIANIIWGGASPIFKYALQNIPPFTLAFIRFSGASIILFPFVWKEFIKLHNEKENLKNIVLFSIFGVTINITFFFLALEYTKSINAPIIGSSGPIMTLIFSVIFLKEHPKINKIIGLIIAFLGILIIIIQPLFENGLDLSVLGNLFLVLATFGAVGQTLIGKNLMQKYPPFPLTFLSFVIGALTFIPMMIPELIDIKPLDSKALVGIVYGVLFSSLAAYSLYAWGLSKIQASEAGLFAYIDPIVAIIIAYPLLGEKPTPLYIIGAILVFSGIFVAEKRINYHPIRKLLQSNIPL